MESPGSGGSLNGAGPRLSARRWMVFVAVVAALAAASRLAVRSHALDDWDAVQYAAALTDYDVSRERPHDPGNPLFVFVARLFHAAGAGDPVAAYVWPNAVVYTAASLLLFG